MQNVESTIISQYGNSATISQLIQNMNDYIDPSADIDNFYNYVFNIETAQGFGLDIWGRIVGVSRIVLSNPVYELSDANYRSLLLLKALSNISYSSAPSINQLLQNWMTGRGRCYVKDLGAMAMSYIFEFALQPFEVVILQQSGIFLRPAGVRSTIVQNEYPVFGFKEMGTTWAWPFGQAPFTPGAV